MTTFLHFNIPASGHINPMLGVISALVARGARVVCCNTEEYRGKLEAAGAEFIPYPDLPEMTDLLTHQHEGDLALNVIGLLKIGQKLLPMVREAIRTVRPDAVLYDSLAGWARWGAELEGVRGAGIVSTFVIDASVMPPLPPVAMMKTMAQFARRTPAYLRVRRDLVALGVKNPPYLQTLMHTSPACNIVFTSKEFQPGGEKLGSRFHFVGVSLAERADKLDFELDPERPLIYVSLGTVNNQNMAFYQTCFEAFKGMNAQVVLSVGRQTNLKDLGTPPANVIVRPFVAQLEVLKHASVFVTHGGLNSVHEGLVYGVPMVVIPQQSEQRIVGMQLESKGAGLLIRQQEIEAQNLCAAVEKLLANHATYQTTAAALGKTLQTAGGAERAAQILLTWAQSS